jgi:hypothetical protein
LLLATLLCCFGQLVNTYAEAQLHKNIVCTNSDSLENCVNQHDDSLDDDQVEPQIVQRLIRVTKSSPVQYQKFTFSYFYSFINWQPPII